MLKHRGLRATIACGTLALGLTQAWSFQTKEQTPSNTAAPAANASPLLQQLLDTVKQATGGDDMNALPTPPKPVTPPPSGAGVSGDARDPFSTTPTIESEAAKLGGAAPLNSTIATPVKFPTMHLRGFASNGSHPSVAILEVTGSGMFFVRTGDKINLPPSGAALGSPVELTIQEIQDQGEFVKVRSQGETVEVRDPGKSLAPPPVPASRRTPPARTNRGY